MIRRETNIMCPICMASAVFTTVGVLTTGGVATIAAKIASVKYFGTARERKPDRKSDRKKLGTKDVQQNAPGMI